MTVAHSELSDLLRSVRGLEVTSATSRTQMDSQASPSSAHSSSSLGSAFSTDSSAVRHKQPFPSPALPLTPVTV